MHPMLDPCFTGLLTMKNYQAFDVETTGLQPFKGDKIFSHSLCDYDGNATVHRIDDKVGPKERKLNKLLMRNIFQDDTTIIIAHNLRFELECITESGIKPNKNKQYHDTMIMSQLLQNLNQSHALDVLAWSLGGYPRDNDREVKKYISKGETYDTVPVDIMNAYQKDDTIRTMLLFRTFWPEIKKDKKLLADYQNEIELLFTTVKMEKRGLMLDITEAEKMQQNLEDEISDLYEDLYRITGERINLGSQTEVPDLLFNRLKLIPIKRTKTGYSTDKEVIFQLRDIYKDDKDQRVVNVLNTLSKHRSYSTNLSKIRNFLKAVEPNGTIYSNINTNRARTGRQSASKPPLHGVSKEVNLFNPYPVKLRIIFRTRPGFINFMPDYAGEEMVLIVNIADDRNMIQAINSGENPHVIFCKIFYGKKFKNKKDSLILYNSGKNGHFALAYGSGYGNLAKTLGITKGQAKAGLTFYAKEFPDIASFCHDSVNEVRDNGYIVTPFGRKLKVPADKPYMGANYKIQGAGAGVIKRAQNRLNNYFEQEWDDEIGVILPVHDELFIEYPRYLLKHSDEVLHTVQDLMTEFPFKVPLKVEWKKTTTSWIKAKGFELN